MPDQQAGSHQGDEEMHDAPEADEREHVLLAAERASECARLASEGGKMPPSAGCNGSRHCFQTIFPVGSQCTQCCACRQARADIIDDAAHDAADDEAEQPIEGVRATGLVEL